MRNDRVAVIIPSYNEGKNIKILIEKIFKSLGETYIYVIDDNSPDETREVVESLKQRHKRLHLIIRAKKSGRGGAVIEGFKNAISITNIDYFIEMDADLSHDPGDIKRLLLYTDKDTIIVGSRYVNGSRILNWPLHRRILSRFANLYIKVILGVPINDFTNGFRCYSKNAVKFLLNKNINHKGFITLSETAYILNKERYKFIEVPITFKDRKRGKSNATSWEVLKSLLAVVQIKFNEV